VANKAMGVVGQLGRGGLCKGGLAPAALSFRLPRLYAMLATNSKNWWGVNTRPLNTLFHTLAARWTNASDSAMTDSIALCIPSLL
jgi:hypothetical protein